MKKTSKIGSIVVIVRRHKERGVEILTQTRRVINKEYDSLYDNTQEVCGETSDPFESIVDTAIRGCREELGTPDFSPLKIIGADSVNVFSSREEELVLVMEPYCFIQQLKGPQPWNSVVFVFIVPHDFEPKPDKEGEVGGHRWWSVDELWDALFFEARSFCGMHRPALEKVCKDIRSGKIIVE